MKSYPNISVIAELASVILLQIFVGMEGIYGIRWSPGIFGSYHWGVIPKLLKTEKDERVEGKRGETSHLLPFL